MTEPKIDVTKIVESRLLRIGIVDRRSSRPGTSMSNSLALIDETRASIVDEPVLGWSSGIPAPIGTPSNDYGGYLTPLDSASQSNSWSRIPTPNSPCKPNPFSPAFSPMVQSQIPTPNSPCKPNPFPPMLQPTLAPLKEEKEGKVGKENLPSDVRVMSRESVRQVGKFCVRLFAVSSRNMSMSIRAAALCEYTPCMHSHCWPEHIRLSERANRCANLVGAKRSLGPIYCSTHWHARINTNTEKVDSRIGA